uniref:dynein axonemal light chain 4-like n=1 Tax=Myxine glutinosa TaxID=7769 RepID=UPI00358F24D8
MAEARDEQRNDDVDIPEDFALVRPPTSMPQEMKKATEELCIIACQKYPSDNELASQFIKEAMDKKFVAPWHVIIGESFSFNITYELQSVFFMFFGGRVAILVWKCL